MDIRLLREEELDAAMNIYAGARAFMRKIGNKDQWGDSWPPRSVLEEDIQKKRLYAVTDDNELKGVFAWWYGPHAEDTYNTVYGGEWISEEPYGVVHRIAAAECSGAGKEAIRWAIKASKGHLKIDTHEDNAAMRHVLKSLGFSERGVILLKNGEPRVAYEIC